MRQVKYRLWCDNKKEWEKDEWYLTPSGRIIDARRQVEMKKETHFLNQFTGLFDKQGKELYEGDICKVINYASDYLKIHGKMYCVISWSNTMGFYGKGFGIPTTFSMGEEFEVIGNIYENPELLEQQ